MPLEQQKTTTYCTTEKQIGVNIIATTTKATSIILKEKEMEMSENIKNNNLERRKRKSRRKR